VQLLGGVRQGRTLAIFKMTLNAFVHLPGSHRSRIEQSHNSRIRSRRRELVFKKEFLLEGRMQLAVKDQLFFTFALHEELSLLNFLSYDCEFALQLRLIELGKRELFRAGSEAMKGQERQCESTCARRNRNGVEAWQC